MTPEIVRAIVNSSVIDLKPFRVFVSTTDATPTTITTVDIDDNTTGFVIIEMVAAVTDGSASNVGSYSVKYIKLAGVLTLSAKVTVWEKTDNAASIDFVNTSDNIDIQVTGIAATNIDWRCSVRFDNINITGAAL